MTGGGEVLVWQIVKYMLECLKNYNSDVAAESCVIDL